MAFNYSPKIVTNGLVLYLDAANTRSYPTTGTTWSDLSRSGNNGTLTNGPTFNSANGGSIVFDGINDSVTIGTVIQNYSIFTTSFWINYQFFSSVGPSSWRSPLGDNSQEFLYHVLFLEGFIYLGFSSGFTGFSYTSPIPHNAVNINTWYNFTITKNSSNIITFYQNGVSLGTTNKAGTVNLNVIGKGYVFDNARISNVTFYNRALTAQEVQQNYNATKTRFGLN